MMSIGLDRRSVQQGVEWVARGSLIALVTGAMMRNVLISQTAREVFWGKSSLAALAAAGVATTAVTAGSSSYRSKFRHIPTTIAADLFGSMVLGWCLGGAIAVGRPVWQSLSGLDLVPLELVCMAGCLSATLMSASCGIGGGAIAFSSALRKGEPWAIEWEETSHDLWATILRFKKDGGSFVTLYRRVVESLPFFGQQYRNSQVIAPPPIQREGVIKWIVNADRLAAQAAYYSVWGGLHLMAFRSARFCYGAGFGVGLFLAIPLQPLLALLARRGYGASGDYLSFFKGGAAEFAERSNRDRLFYFAGLFLGALCVDYAVLGYPGIFLPVVLGFVAANQFHQVVRTWQQQV
jgi:hypothetical protein